MPTPLQGRTTLLGMPLDTGLAPGVVVDRLLGGQTLLSYINPLAWKVAAREHAYLGNLESMDMVVCDGIAVRSAAWRFLRKEVEIVSLDYSGIAAEYLEAFRCHGDGICLVGARDGVAGVAAERLRSDFPGIRLEGAFSGYGDGPANAISFILETRPEVVLAGLGMGRQEAFLLQLRESGWNGSGICVGAFFDRLSDNRLDYPAWSKKRNIRYLGNLTRRPAYYLRRYGVDYLPFMKQYVGEAFGKRSSRE